MNPLVRETVKRLQALEQLILNEEKFLREHVCSFDADSIYFARQTIRDVSTRYERRLAEESENSRKTAIK